MQAFDMAKLSRYESVVPLADLFNSSRPGGRMWNGTLDGLLHFNGDHVDTVSTAALSTRTAVRLPTLAPVQARSRTIH